jgi:hypothetical protein
MLDGYLRPRYPAASRLDSDFGAKNDSIIDADYEASFGFVLRLNIAMFRPLGP